jgi:hypothetical protein
MIWVEKKKNMYLFYESSLTLFMYFSWKHVFYIYKKIIIIKARSDKKNKKPWLYNLNAIEKEWIIWENHKKEI